MSLFGSYIKERQGKEIVESEHGFATYFFLNDGVYIEDIFVDSGHRQEHLASQMADTVASVAKAKGYNKMYGTVNLAANHATPSLKVLLSYGFQLDSCGQGFIVLKKEI